MLQQTVDLLGLKAKDRVSGLEGVITSVCFDLYGCVQVAIDPPVNEKGERQNGTWFDVNRVQIDIDSDRVMPVPDFQSRDDVPQNYAKGASDKPSPPGSC